MFALIFALSGGGGEGSPSLITSFIPILLKKHQDVVSALRRGDRIVTNGGLYGTVVDVKEHILVLKIAEDVKIELVKSAVATVIERRED